MLFGEDIESIISGGSKPLLYKNNEDKIEELGIRDFMMNIMHDFVSGYYNPLSGLFPFLNDYLLINPFKRNAVNIATFSKRLAEAIEESKDENSICKRIFKHFDQTNQLEREEVIDDLISFMIAGTDTSSHTVTTILYYLKKYPEVEKKLMEHLKSHGFDSKADPHKVITSEKIQELDYLNYVIREALRMDTPAVDTFGYEAFEDVVICGVPIPKGTQVRLDIFGAHYNPKEWQEPKKFIPERFDPESEYFKKPASTEDSKSAEKESSGKGRSPYSWLAFSQGMRACPGQTLAMLEIKIMLCYFLIKYDYEIDPDFLQKEGVGFGVGSHLKLNIKLKKRQD